MIERGVGLRRRIAEADDAAVRRQRILTAEEGAARLVGDRGRDGCTIAALRQIARALCQAETLNAHDVIVLRKIACLALAKLQYMVSNDCIARAPHALPHRP